MVLYHAFLVYHHFEGLKFQRKLWFGEETYFVPKQVDVRFTKAGQPRAKVVGVFTFRGCTEDVERSLKSGSKEKKILIVFCLLTLACVGLKREWRLMEESTNTQNDNSVEEKV